MAHSRHDRIQERLKKQIGEILLTEVRDPRLGFVTVTDLELSSDLRHARIFVSVLGDEKERDRCLEGLASATSFVRGLLARRIQLRHVPELVFVFDPSVERAARVMAILDRLQRERERREREA